MKTGQQLLKEAEDLLQEVRGFLSKIGEADSREHWKDSIVKKLKGAAVEFFKCKLHDKLNAHHEDRHHWEKEWRHHLDNELYIELTTKTHFKDKQKAFVEAVDEFAADAHRFMTQAANVMAKYLNGNNNDFQKVLDDQDEADFYTEVEDYMTQHWKNYVEETEAPPPSKRERREKRLQKFRESGGGFREGWDGKVRKIKE